MDYKRIYSIVAKIILSRTMTETEWQSHKKRHPHSQRKNHHIIPNKNRKKNNQKSKSINRPINRQINNPAPSMCSMIWDGKDDEIRNALLNADSIEDKNFGKKKHGINQIYKFNRKKSPYSSIFKPTSRMAKGLRKSLTSEISQTEREVIAFNISKLLGLKPHIDQQKKKL